MIGQYFNASKGLRYAVLVFTLPQIPYLMYAKTTGMAGTWVSELVRSSTKKPFNLNLENDSTNALGRPVYYKDASKAF